MRYEMNFGRLTVASSRPTGKGGKVFRLALLGDFSARSNKGELATGAELASRKPLRVDVDNIDDTIARMGLQLRFPLAEGGDLVEIDISCLDDFHPDELADNLEVFAELSNLRRRVSNTSTFAEAAKEVQQWQPAEVSESGSGRPRSGATAMPRGKLSDFAKLVGSDIDSSAGSGSADELVKQVVAPYIVAAADPQQDAFVEIVDQALSATMRAVLHHPDFQAVESLWRSVDLLTRQLETDTQLQIVLYDITAEEIAADLSRTDDLTETGLYQLFVEKPVNEQEGALSVLVGNYLFEQTPPHAELLGRLSQIAAAAGAPFLAAISADVLAKKKPEEVHSLITESWEALRAMPHARYLGLTVPRFMLRWPYGAKTEPIDPFSFEEFTPKSGLRGMLWGNGAILAGLLLGQTFTAQGLDAMKLGSIMTVGDMPFYYYTDKHGDQVALPCTERVVSEPVARQASTAGYIPLLAFKARPEVRLGGFTSVAGDAIAGPWNPVEISATGEVAEPIQEEVEEEEVAAVDDDDDDDDSVTDATDEEVRDEPDDDEEETASAPADDDDDGDAGDDGQSELDALLAELESDTEESDDDEMDPELAALLADL